MILCTQISNCDCLGSNPFKNISSEATDTLPTVSVVYLSEPPPLDVTWNQFTGIGVAYSSVGQSDADTQAYNAAFAQAICTWDNPDGTPFSGLSCPGGPNFFNQAFPGGGSGPPSGTFLSSSQTATATCPDGSLFTFTVPAARFSGSTQQAADSSAFAFAQSQANAHVICLSNIQPQVCLGSATNIVIKATGNFLAVSPAGDFWELASGTLPIGLTFNGGVITGGMATITGTPTQLGSYSFAISVTDPVGDIQTKNYILTVAAVTGSLPQGVKNTPYSTTLTAAGMTNGVFLLQSGTLPTGLLLSSAGVISGTPTVAVTDAVVIQAKDSATGFICTLSGSIVIVNNTAFVVQLNQTSDTPPQQNVYVPFTPSAPYDTGYKATNVVVIPGNGNSELIQVQFSSQSAVTWNFKVTGTGATGSAFGYGEVLYNGTLFQSFPNDGSGAFSFTGTFNTSPGTPFTLEFVMVIAGSSVNTSILEWTTPA